MRRVQPDDIRIEEAIRRWIDVAYTELVGPENPSPFDNRPSTLSEFRSTQTTTPRPAPPGSNAIAGWTWSPAAPGLPSGFWTSFTARIKPSVPSALYPAVADVDAVGARLFPNHGSPRFAACRIGIGQLD